MVLATPVRPIRLASRRGFTMIELMIALIVMGVIISVALPSFQGAARKSRRSEAFTALSNVQQAQERIRSSFDAYASSITNAPTASPRGLGMAATRTGNGYYDLAISLIGGGTTGYVASATGVSTSSQGQDGNCIALAVRVDGGNVRYGAASSLAGIDWSAANADPNRCWAR